MKTLVAGVFLIAVCLFFYNEEHPFGRPDIPKGHQYSAKGVYFLRTAHSIPDAAGEVKWKPGQQVFADHLAKNPAPAGMLMVTDGTHSTAIPAIMLSEDVQEGQDLRQVEIDAISRQAQADAEEKAQGQARVRAEAQAQAKAQALAEAQSRAQTEAQEAARLRASQRPAPAATPKFGHTSLDQPAQAVPGGVYQTYPYPYYRYYNANPTYATPRPQ